jgi:putative hydrolase of the HAD superfamily
LKISGIQHIFFDLDHTLWDFEKNAFLAFDKILKELKIDLETNVFMHEYNPINVAYWKLYEQNKIDQETLRVKRLADTFTKLSTDITREQIDLISDLFIQYLTENNFLMDNCLEILDYLQPNYQLHIITNGFAAVQEKKLQRSNINHFFKTITDSELAGDKKPSKTIYDFALKKANANLQNAIMIGDSIKADILGAKNFGMEAIYFNSKKENCPAEIMQIDNLIQLKKYL